VACGVVAGVIGPTCTARAQNRELQVQKVIDLLRQAKYQQSLSGVDTLLAATPDDCRLLSLRGMALSGLQKPVEAAESYQKALRSCPEDLLALEGAAQIEYARRKPDAVNLLQRILQLRPKDVTAHAMLASMYRAKEECKEALPHFEASAQMFADRPNYQQAYAYCLADTGHYKQAATNYEEVLGVWRQANVPVALPQPICY
jgi:predicted Zn-dependent protease